MAYPPELAQMAQSGALPANLIQPAYLQSMVAKMRENPVMAQSIYSRGMQQMPAARNQLEQQAMLAQQKQMMLAPTSMGGLAGHAALSTAFLPAAQTALQPASRLWGKIRGTQRGTPLKQIWSKGNLAKNLKMGFVPTPGMLGFGAALEGIGGLSAAANDPRYQRGEIGYGGAVGSQLSRMGQASQAKATEAFQGPMGPLTGLVAAPVHGMFNPIGTVTGFGQALKRFSGFGGKQAADGPLTQLIKQNMEKLGQEGSTLAELAKAANYGDDPTKPPSFLAPQKTDEPVMPDSVRRRLQLQAESQGPGLRQRMLGALLGLSGSEVGNLTTGLRGVSTVVGKAKGLAQSLQGKETPYYAGLDPTVS